MNGRSGRLLLALADSTREKDDYSENFTFEGISVAVAGILCLICVLLMCVCKKSEQNERSENIKHQQASIEKEKQSEAQIKQNGADVNPAIIVNGDKAQMNAISPGQPYAVSHTPPLTRPTNTRVLPAPPVFEQTVHDKVLVGSEQYTAVETHQANEHHRSFSSRKSRKTQLQPNSNDYDHVGQKPSVTPQDYSTLDELKRPEVVRSEAVGKFDDDYSIVEEKIYPVIIDVSPKKTRELSDPYSKFASYYDNQLREEDVYNNIGESDETVSASLRHGLKQLLEPDNPYALVLDDDASGESKTGKRNEGACGGTEQNRINPQDVNNQRKSFNIQHTQGTNGEDYAVIQKDKNKIKKVEETDELTFKERKYSDASAGPPEPPRLYSVSDSLENITTTGVSTKSSRPHNYSQVTARESLASISERKNRNVYELVGDTADNMYTTVDGWSADSTKIGGASSGNEEARLSLISDIYAEIGISGEGVSSSFMNKASNQEQNNRTLTVLPSGSSSVDSLRTMTKPPAFNSTKDEQDTSNFSTSEENNNFNQWTNVKKNEDSSDTYVALKEDSHLPTFGWNESDDISHVQNNFTVSDCVSNNKGKQVVDDYPDYEIVDDTNLKVMDNALESNIDSLGERRKKFGQGLQKLHQ